MSAPPRSQQDPASRCLGPTASAGISPGRELPQGALIKYLPTRSVKPFQRGACKVGPPHYSRDTCCRSRTDGHPQTHPCMLTRETDSRHVRFSFQPIFRAPLRAIRRSARKTRAMVPGERFSVNGKGRSRGSGQEDLQKLNRPPGRKSSGAHSASTACEKSSVAEAEADRLVELNAVDTVGRETVRKALKRTGLRYTRSRDR